MDSPPQKAVAHQNKTRKTTKDKLIDTGNIDQMDESNHPSEQYISTDILNAVREITKDNPSSLRAKALREKYNLPSRDPNELARTVAKKTPVLSQNIPSFDFQEFQQTPVLRKQTPLQLNATRGEHVNQDSLPFDVYSEVLPQSENESRDDDLMDDNDNNSIDDENVATEDAIDRTIELAISRIRRARELGEIAEDIEEDCRNLTDLRESTKMFLVSEGIDLESLGIDVDMSKYVAHSMPHSQVEETETPDQSTDSIIGTPKLSKKKQIGKESGKKKEKEGISIVSSSRQRSRARRSLSPDRAHTDIDDSSEAPSISSSVPGTATTSTTTTPPPPVDTQALWTLAIIFFFAVLAMMYLIRQMPELSAEELDVLRLPRSLDDVKNLSIVLLRYKEDNFMLVLGLFAMSYIFLQTFAIPGAIFLSVLAGPLFGFFWGMIIVSIVATTGSSMCYLLSKALSKNLVARYFPQLLQDFQQRVQDNRDNLFFYMLFLRISPVLPNWFISVSSPILGVPLWIFALATFLGIMPGNYIHVSTGVALSSLATNTGDGSSSPVNFKNLAGLFAVGLLALIPIVLKNQVEACCKKQRQDENDGNNNENN